jgi:hypothetical protein
LLFVGLQLIGSEFAPSRVFAVVAMNLCVAFETNRNCVFDVISAAVRSGDNVVSLDFYTAKPVADTASSMALD